jgi:hypothetical protein
MVSVINKVGTELPFLEYDVALLGIWVPKYRRNVLPLFSRAYRSDKNGKASVFGTAVAKLIFNCS